jgi:hypothetical protein
MQNYLLGLVATFRVFLPPCSTGAPFFDCHSTWAVGVVVTKYFVRIHGLTGQTSSKTNFLKSLQNIVSPVAPANVIDNNMQVLTLADSFINSYSQLLARPESHKDLTSVQNWLKFNKDAIYEPEREFMEYEDLIGIHPKSRSCFRKVLEYSFLLRMQGLRRFFKRTPREYDLIKDNSGAYTTWQYDRKVEGCSSTLVAVIGLRMLVGPLWILAKASNPMHRLGIITGFIALFFVLVKVATRARIFDALAAASAYSAVLMVFLQAIAI